ncbi:MAG TPA: enoyl-CoA hydratase/isomerase family protein [Acidimicrobiia bacterium]
MRRRDHDDPGPGGVSTVIDLDQHGDVWVLTMRNGENRFDLESIAALHAALDRVEQVETPVALVTTGEGKFYSNGLDLDWLLSAGPEAAGFIDDVHRLLGRVLGFAGVTVAAVNGHAFAGGAMLTAAHDAVVMRDDRGYWCLPEVDLGLPLSPAMYAVVAAHISEPTLRVALHSGRRYSAADALAAGIVHEVATESAVVERAIARASEVASKNRDVIRAHKRLMYADALRLCGVE